MKRMLLTVFLLVSLGGCDGGDGDMVYEKPKEAAKHPLSIFTVEAEALALEGMNASIRHFEEKFPEYEVVFEAYRDATVHDIPFAEVVDNRMAGGEPNDIIMMYVDNIFKWSKAGKLADLSDTVAASKLLPYAREDCTVDGRIMGIPLTGYAFGLWMNMDMLKTCGLEPPNNWDEFLHCCRVLKEHGFQPICGTRNFMKMYAMAYGLSELYAGDDSAQRIEELNSGRVKISHYMLPGFQALQTLVDEGHIDAVEALRHNPRETNALFLAGTACFAAQGSLPPDEIAAAQFAYRFAGLPTRTGSVILCSTGRKMAVPSDGRNVEAAKTLLDALVTDALDRSFMSHAGSLPCRIGVAPPAQSWAKAFYACYEQGSIMPMQNNALLFEQWGALNSLSNGLLEGKSPEEQAAAFDALQEAAIR